MAGRVSIVEPDDARRAAISAALSVAYIEEAEAGGPADLVIADEGAGEAPAALKARHGGAPVLFIGPAGGAARAFAEGADDFLARPAEPRLLLARARRLIRRRASEVELSLRAATARELGVEPEAREAPPPPRLLLVAPKGPEAEALRAALAALSGGEARLAPGGFAALRAAETDPPDAVIVADGLERLSAGGFAEGEDAIGLIAALRARGEAGRSAIVHLCDDGAASRAVAALAAGADESAPGAEGSAEEMAARLLAELDARRRLSALRDGVEAGLRAAAEDSLTDPLTGLRNRRYFDRHASRLATRAAETNGRLSLLLFDLDRFKAVNDSLGHDAGDAVLRAFAERLRLAVRGADLVARIGGEEFAAILVGAGAAEASAVAERVRAAVARAPVPAPGGGQIALTVSVGVAAFQAGAAGEIAALLRQADEALRAAKRGGRDRVEFAG